MNGHVQKVTDNRTEHEWWRGATVYQIYPRSFSDSNNDGIGDLPGITAKLDYVASLGVDAIWISPFYPSPMKDFGYDIADYCDVDPIFGSLKDFDALISKAHALGLRVTVDQVYSHTSDHHAWFSESRSSRSNAKSDWYVWADAKEDGSPPSNWQSVFGGPAWTWDARRRQYYLHNFLAGQPQLNVHNPDVQNALLDVARFWLDRGVDGFRIDALNFAMHDPALKDNPPAAPSNRPKNRSFDFQRRLHNQSHPDIPIFVERIRALVDQYGDCFTVAEVGGDNAEREMKLFTAGNNRLNSAYGFDFLYADHLTPNLVREAIEAWPDTPGMGWPSWAFENHDAARAVSRWTLPENARAFSNLKMLLLTSLRGNIFVYQGEELGLTQVDIPFDKLQDPEAIANWPLTLSRDGARTPMPWQATEPNCGFSNADPWLPLGVDHPGLAVDCQEQDQASMLALTRHLIAFRAANPALLSGTINVIAAHEDLLVFERHANDQRLICAFNFGASPLAWSPNQPDRWLLLEQVNGASISLLPPFAGLVAEQIT
jgi:alpha-glucosidase